MKSTVIISCMLTACSAIFFPLINLPNQRQTMMNVCIYSRNPNEYRPRCFMCPSTVYPNVLGACVQAAAMPSNINYTQAACIEQNCMISRGKRSVDSKLENYENLVQGNVISQENEDSPSDNSAGPLQDDEASIEPSYAMKTINVFASDDTDYEDVDDFEDS